MSEDDVDHLIEEALSELIKLDALEAARPELTPAEFLDASGELTAARDALASAINSAWQRRRRSVTLH